MSAPPATTSSDGSSLEARVESLEAEMRELRALVEALQSARMPD
jgi:hypothetical protein